MPTTERHRLYRVWYNMKDRCYNPKLPCFRNYGAKGISVCPEWAEFQPFYDWSKANGYALGLSIERKDGRKGYNPDNCTWATRKQQNRNRIGVPVSPDGTPWCSIAEANGVTQTAFENRIYRGWPHQLAAETGPQRRSDPRVSLKARLAAYQPAPASPKGRG